MSDLSKLQQFIDDKRQWRNKASRNLAKILYDILEHNEPAKEPAKEKDSVPEEKNDEKIEDEDDEDTEEDDELLAEPYTEPEPVNEPAKEPEVFKMDDVSDLGTIEEESEMMDTMSLLEVSVAGDMESQDGAMELVQIGGYTYEQAPCKACLVLREKKSYKGGQPVPFRWFQLYCGACQRSQYKLYKSQKAEENAQKKIDQQNNRIIGNRSLQQRNIEDLKTLKNAKNPGADTTEMKNGIKECVKRGQPVSVSLFIK